MTYKTTLRAALGALTAAAMLTVTGAGFASAKSSCSYSAVDPYTGKASPYIQIRKTARKNRTACRRARRVCNRRLRRARFFKKIPTRYRCIRVHTR